MSSLPHRGTGTRRSKIHVELAQSIPRPLDPLLDVGFVGEQRAGDLGGTETAERPQRDLVG